MLPPPGILHVDLDAFFAAVEVRDDPSLRGRPVVVGADPRGGRGRGVVCTASYEARRFGVRSAMPISEAFRRCPQAVYLAPRHEHYAAISKQFFAVLGRSTDLVEPLSIDEAFLDVRGSLRLFGDAVRIAHELKRAVRDELALTASVGVAPVKFAAKIASDLRKPDGLLVVRGEELQDFLDPLPVGRLFGAGPKVRERLEELQVLTVADLRRADEGAVVRAVGESTARHLLDLARGIDPRSVDPHRARKSLGKEHTFFEDQRDREVVETLLLSLLEESAAMLRAQGLVGHTVTLKLRTAEFRTLTRQRKVPEASTSVVTLWPIVRELFRGADPGRGALRLVGVSFSNLARPERGLFDTEGAPTVREQKLEQALDAVARRFGRGAVVRGRLLGPRADDDGGNRAGGGGLAGDQ